MGGGQDSRVIFQYLQWSLSFIFTTIATQKAVQGLVTQIVMGLLSVRDMSSLDFSTMSGYIGGTWLM